MSDLKFHTPKDGDRITMESIGQKGALEPGELCVEMAHTGRFRSYAPNLQRLPLRTEEGKKIRDAFLDEERKKMPEVDYAKTEKHVLVNTGGETVSVLMPADPPPVPSRREQIKKALDNAPHGFLSALRQLKTARAGGGNRRQRRGTAVVQRNITRILKKAGITLVEALELV